MDWDKISGLVRHVLTFVAGYLAAKGLVDETMVNELVAAVMTIIGVAWSWRSKPNKIAQSE